MRGAKHYRRKIAVFLGFFFWVSGPLVAVAAEEARRASRDFGEFYAGVFLALCVLIVVLQLGIRYWPKIAGWRKRQVEKGSVTSDP